MDHYGMTESEWRELVGSLEDVGPYYEKVNMLMTFGLVDRWRRHVASIAKSSDSVLEIGPGPGYFTRHLNAASIYCLEPSIEFANSDRNLHYRDRADMVKGVAEKIPLSTESVDKVFCVFSFRDFYDKPAALCEINRILREGGEIIVADVTKPESPPLAKMIEMHFKRVVPVLARVAVNPSARHVWSRNPYSRLAETWNAYGTPSDYETLFRKSGFVEITTEFLELKGAAMTRGKKPRKSTS